MNVVRVSHTTPDGQVLRVVHGDLTRETSEAIVNAANSMLAHGGGVAGAILRAGGHVIDEDSDAWVHEFGEVPTGGVAVTRSGALPCKAVLHAVGPVWDGGHRGEARLLATAVHNVLTKAAEMGFVSVALPAISSGIFGFPKRMCADILLEEALAWCAAAPMATVREIRFTNFDAPTVAVFLDAFAARLGVRPTG